MTAVFAGDFARFRTAEPAFSTAFLTVAIARVSTDLTADARPAAVFAAPVLRAGAAFFGAMARSTLPAAFCAPAAADRAPRATARFALPSVFSAPACTALVLRVTVRFALRSATSASAWAAFAVRATVAAPARAFASTAVVAFSTSCIAPAAASPAVCTSDVPASCVFSAAVSTASPILVNRLLSPLTSVIFETPVR